MSKRDVRLFIDDIKDSLEAIVSYVEAMNLENFLKDRKT
jgi:uncharacterized protein with HEPN domain